jgi:cAMP-dependent protein kinase regulator
LVVEFVSALDVLAFERLLGPCLELMRRNLASYDEDMARAFGGEDQISDLR